MSLKSAFWKAVERSDIEAFSSALFSALDATYSKTDRPAVEKPHWPAFEAAHSPAHFATNVSAYEAAKQTAN